MLRRCLWRLVQGFGHVATGSKARSDLVDPGTFVHIILRRRTDGCGCRSAAQVKPERPAIGFRRALAACAERFDSDRISADPLLLALQPVQIELGLAGVRTRPSACAGRETRDQHQMAKCEQCLHRIVLFRHISLALRIFPTASAVWWPSNAQGFHHCFTRVVHYIL